MSTEYSLDENRVIQLKSVQMISGNVVRKTDSRINYADFEREEIKSNQDELENQFMVEILNIIRNDEYEDGTISNSEKYILDVNTSDSRPYLKSALMKLYLDNLGNEKILTGILLMISTIPYTDACPEGPIMAMGLLQNKSYAVRDKAIQAFERWNSKQGIEVLRNLNCDKKWLQRYVNKVIAYLVRDGIE